MLRLFWIFKTTYFLWICILLKKIFSSFFFTAVGLVTIIGHDTTMNKFILKAVELSIQIRSVGYKSFRWIIFSIMLNLKSLVAVNSIYTKPWANIFNLACSLIVTCCTMKQKECKKPEPKSCCGIIDFSRSDTNPFGSQKLWEHYSIDLRNNADPIRLIFKPPNFH